MKTTEHIDIPLTENTYPANLIRAAVLVSETNDSENAKMNVWEYSIPEVLKWVSTLTEREQRIIEMRYRYGLTLEATGDEFNVTRERIRQKEKSLLRLLRWKINDMRLVPLADLKNAEVIIAQKNLDIAELTLKLKESGIPVEDKTDKAPVTIDIIDLELSCRSYNCLKRAGLNTVEDIINFDKSGRNWLGVRNLGRKSLGEVRKRIREYCGYEIRIPAREIV